MNTHNLATLISGPWAITAEMFAEVQGVYARWLAGNPTETAEAIAAAETKLGRPLNNKPAPTAITPEGVALIQIDVSTGVQD